jgi:hypothetical protein
MMAVRYAVLLIIAAAMGVGLANAPAYEPHRLVLLVKR